MDISPIKTESDYEKALRNIEDLWGAEEGTEQGDRLDILLVLADDYESKHYPISPPDPVEAIKFSMEQMGLSRKDLAPYLGGIDRVTEILDRHRTLSLEMIKSLHKNLQIPLESLIGAV
uniref:HTH-type transcriptional regulator / antitoxin HigA n=1 Tax=Candidatus Kentrum eta TaxID=2126337 RepID=A0A450UAL5_9GAMM|nr:MAG: HTH-type transcriptional regulator / antitoxin HigA [Candidatus Kentron sp. H]VFJ91085.1 MAG: HTH-type transcriptional regulator / antitoxin HigA [Candidatus Kentron sp. H]VFJ97392.1 MAG: HTH-type transcriptional regulator / antitoxin HigA [Candidatus Kentron sp. H]